MEYCDRLKQQGRIKTAKVYKESISNVLKLLKKKDLDFQDVSVSLLLKFESELLRSGVSENSISVYMRAIRAIFNRGVTEGVVRNVENPFKVYKVSKLDNRTVKRALTKAQIKSIIDLKTETNSKLEFAKDVFLFSYYYRRMNSRDLALLRRENLQDDRIYYNRSKTGQNFSILLLPPALEILNRMKFIPNTGNYLFPILSEFHNTPQRVENRLTKVIRQVKENLKVIGNLAGLGNHLTAQYWEYDPRYGRRWNLDPVRKYYFSQYATFSNNPLRNVDWLGDNDGDYYSKEGKHLGNDGKNDDKVCVTDKKTVDDNTNDNKTDCAKVQQSSRTTDLTKTYDISHTNLLNCAHWVYGEGGGNFPDHYAHAIKNLKAHGVWEPGGPFKSDEAMFKHAMLNKKKVQEVGKDGKTRMIDKIVSEYPGYFNGTTNNGNAQAFASLRPNLGLLTSNTAMAKCISAIIVSLTGETSDPINGAYQWVGGVGTGGPIAKSINSERYTNITNVVSGTGRGQRYHTFHSLIEKR